MIWLAASRWRHQALALPVALGVLMATALLCLAPLYGELVSDLQVQYVLGQAAQSERNIEVVARRQQIAPALREEDDALVRSRGARYLAAITAPHVTSFLAADDMGLLRVGNQHVQGSILQVQFEGFDFAQTGPHMHLLAGGLPEPVVTGTPQAVVTAQMAHDLDVHVGDVLVAALLNSPNERLSVQVVGVWTPTSLSDPFWNGQDFTTYPIGNLEPAVYPVLLDGGAFVSAFAALPGLGIDQRWIYYLIPARISAANGAAVAANLARLRSNLAGELPARGVDDVFVITALDSEIQEVRQELGLFALPLYAAVGPPVCVAVIFVLVIASILVDSEAAAVAKLLSRGASLSQLLGSYAVQGLITGGICLLAGPSMAAALALGVVHWLLPPAAGGLATATSALVGTLAHAQAVLLLAAVGALAGISALLLAARAVGMVDVVAFYREQGWSMRVPLWQRQYLDLGLVAVCLVGYIELNQFGSLVIRAQLGTSANSLVLLAEPALLLVAGALLAVRALAAVALVGSFLAACGRGAVGALVFFQLRRTPTGSRRLAVLLVLAVAAALFSSVFAATIARNGADRAAYEAGADFRVAVPPMSDTRAGADVMRALAALPAVRGVTPAYRGQADIPGQAGALPVALLGVDVDSWAKVAGAVSWRGVYAGTTLADMMAGLRRHRWGAPDADRAGETDAGDPSHPIFVLISRGFAASQGLRLGDRFALELFGAGAPPSTFVVGAIVDGFPTLYPGPDTSGFAVLGLDDYLGTLAITGGVELGPNEFWLRSSPGAADHARLAAALDGLAPTLGLNRVADREALENAQLANPLEAGLRGLLILGAIASVIFVVAGEALDGLADALSQRSEYRVLRAVGMGRRQLVAMLLGRQVVIYGFGILSGTLLGLVVAAATMPFLQFSTTAARLGMLEVPTYVLAYDPTVIGLLYGALLLGGFLAWGAALVRYSTVHVVP